MTDDDVVVFAESEPEAPDSRGNGVWDVLLVDDEPDVHATTLLALKGLTLEGRQLAFTHAHSAAEAHDILRRKGDFAVAIVDVVMEHDDAGLRLVRQVREELGNTSIRIILRTGQPGYAPEIDTIQRYDINDYKTKAELTRVRLFTSVTIAIRSYAQIQQLNTSRRGLEQVLGGMRELGKPAGLKKFAAGIVTQLCALLEVGEDCLVCAAMETPDAPAFVLAGAGQYAPCVGMPLEAIPQARVRIQLAETLRTRMSAYEHGASLYFPGDQQQALAAYVDIARPLDAVERGLLDVFCSNISVAFENLQLHTAISNLAYTDEALGVPNRNGLIEAMAAVEQPGAMLALVDIDSFSDINSTLSEAFGDAVLGAVVKRLRAVLPYSVCVARTGADVFGLYGPGEDLHIGAIDAVFAEPFDIPDASPLRVSVTSGWVQVGSSPCDAAALLKDAGAALKQAKTFRRGRSVLYQAEMAKSARDRMQLLNELRAAFSSQGLFLNYQPFVSLKTGAIVGAEALLRWRKQDGSFVPPDRFISMAEQSGFIVPLGDWVLRTALRWRASISSMVSPDFRIAVNISQTQFRETDFLDRLLGIVEQCGVLPNCIELELTESVASDNIDLTEQKIITVRQRGYRVALDDFGTGFSSLSVLQHLPVDRVKIDKSFVSGGNAQTTDMAVAHTVLTLAHKLGIETIAEGVETDGQRSQLAEAGCDEGQGYLFSRPLPEESFIQLLERQAG